MATRPNVIWIFGDQHRAQATGYAGDRNAHTPRLDAMRERGCLFSQAVAGCPWCAPFRAALLTGVYNHKHVVRTPQQLDPAFPLVTDALRAEGYRTAYFGKWHLDGHNEMTFIPRERRGRFDTWIGYENNNAPYETWVHGHDEAGRDDREALAEKLPGYETDALTDKLLAYTSERREEPFFAVLSVQPPHDPHLIPPGLEGKYDPAQIELRPNVPPVERIRQRAREDLAGYYAQIENLDANVGRVLDHLEATGQAENTWVLFFSDHGDMHGSHGYVRKSSPWEESIRIPFVVQAPQGHELPTESRVPLNHVDIAPTTLGLCGIEPPPGMMGTDWSGELLPTREVPTGAPQTAFLQHIYRKRFACLNRPWRGVRTTDGWKFICLEGQPFGLFDLNEDPYQLNNLAFQDTHNAKREELQGELATWIERTGDAFTLPEL